MEKLIKITKSLRFDFCDLMREVDGEHDFTLRDVLNVCKRSRIPLSILQQILRCNYIGDYLNEMNKKKTENDKSGIIYLELGWHAEIDKFGGKENSHSSWHFCGMGKKGVIPEDLLKNCTTEEIEKMKKEKWQQSYAIEFTPIYDLASYPIKIRKEISVTDWRNHKKKIGPDDLYTKLDVRPSITLIELLYWIFWELSFLGSPEKRDAKLKDLNKTAEELKRAIEDGRIDEVTVPWKDVKKRLKKKIREGQKSKGG